MDGLTEKIATLQKSEPLLVALAKAAERQAEDDPNGALIKLGQLGEHVVRRVAEKASIAWRDVGGGTLELTSHLATLGHIPAHATGPLHRLRMSRNRAVHEHWGSPPDVRAGLADVKTLSAWLVEVLGSTAGRDDGNGPPPRRATEVEERPRSAGSDQPELGQSPSVPPPEGWPKTALDVLGLLDDARALLDEFRIGHHRIAEAITSLRNEMDAAVATFRLGVAGEFRAGKSTLINAIAGRRLALTDTVEATAALSSYRWGERAEAEIVFTDGRRSCVNVEEANALLSEHRHNDVWLSTIDHVSISAPSDALRGVELWDAPGIGGRDSNERLANTFIERISAAVWVLDATLLGSASILAPLDQLRSSGKLVIGVLNHIDELTPEQVTEAIAYVNTTYPDRFALVLPLSAVAAFEKTASGRADQHLDTLRRAIQECLIDTASERRELRIGRALVNGAARGIAAVRADSGQLTESLGLLEHIEEGYRDGRRRTIEALPRSIDRHLETLWEYEERLISTRFAELENNLQKGKTDGFTERLERLWTDAAEMLSRAAQDTPVRILEDVRSHWMQLTEENVSWTRTSMPELRVGGQALIPHVDSADSGEEAVKHSVNVAAVAAGVLAAVAIASAAITWPIVLVALPIGGAEGARHWFGSRPTTNSVLKNALREAKSAFDDAIVGYRAQLRQDLLRELTPRVDAVLMESSARSLDDAEKKLLRPHTRREAVALLEQLRGTRESLAKSSPEGTDDRLDTVAIPGGEGATRALEMLLARETVRVDVVTGDLNTRVVLDALRLVGPEARLRILTSVPIPEEGPLAKSLNAFGAARPGALEVRNLRTVSGGGPVDLGPETIVTTEGAWRLSARFGSIGSMEIVASSHPNGKMAAEREFAKRWDGGWRQGNGGPVQTIARTIC